VPDSEYAMDFFVSHADTDTQWAEWIAAELERAGYGVIVKAWDFRPGENSLARHDEALATCRHTLCVLSPAYVESEVAARTAAHYQALEGKERALIPVRVADCVVPPLLGPYIQIDLADIDDEDAALQQLLTGVAGRVPRVARGGFPKSSRTRVRFPGVAQDAFELRGHRPDPYFVGRDDELADLYRALRAGRPTSAVQVITGLGGLGKTRLAVEYAFRHDTAYSTVWWIRAEDSATMRGDYVELAQTLGLPFDNDNQAIAALRQELRRRRDWLLIFDNAEDPDDLFALLPEKHQGHVLVTSRRREWPHTETHRIGNLSTPAAVEYLEQRGRVADATKARDLAEALGCLPLGLVQAASVVAGGMPVADYLDALHKQSPELFSEGRAPDHELTIDSTWRVSVDHLTRRSSAAVAVFRLAAFLAADAIPLAMLKPTADMPTELSEALANPFQLNRATAALGEYSLAETTEGLLSIHRMVQAVTRAELVGEAPHWAGLALAAVVAAFPENVEDPRSWEDCERLLAHVLTCTAHANHLHIETTPTVQLLDNVTRYLLARGRIDTAATVLAQALDMAEQLRRDDLVYLSSRNTLGLLLMHRGDPSAARKVLEEVYEARSSVLGSENLETLRAARDLVQALYGQGHLVQAAELQDRVVEKFIAILGPNDLETVTSLAYQATIFFGNGRHEHARALEEQVLEARRQVLGEDHPDTLLAKLNLAITVSVLGKRSEARAMEEQVVEARRRVLGEDHPGTLMAKLHLAETLFLQGALNAARTLEGQVVEARRRVLGEDHPDTLMAKANLGTTLVAMGDLDQGRTLHEEVLEARGRVLGEDAPATLDAKLSLAETLRAQNELSQSRAMAEQVLEARCRDLGEDHPNTLRAELNLVDTLQAQNELSQARAIGERVLEGLRQKLGDDQLETQYARTSLAKTMFAQGDLQGATLLLTESLAISLRIFGKTHTVTTEAAWTMLQQFGVHETQRRNAFIFMYLAWLSTASASQLTAEQKKIKEELKRVIYVGKTDSRPKKPRPKKHR
jgi:tetratricopeptide (TPR) repeat protein